MKPQILLVLGIVSIILVSGCTQLSNTNNQTNQTSNNNNQIDTFAPIKLDDFAFNMNASWEAWNGICNALKGDNKYLTVLKVGLLNLNANTTYKTVDIPLSVVCDVKVDNTPRTFVIFRSGTDENLIYGNMVTGSDGKQYSGEDVTKSHIIELCCKIGGMGTNDYGNRVSVISDEVCNTKTVNKLC